MNFKASDLRARAGGITASAAGAVLKHSATTEVRSFDIFLSHAVADAVAVLGLARWLESSGVTVYVDWLDDGGLNRESVSPETAGLLRERMQQCRSLIFATSKAARASKWMPWELGYFDGFRGSKSVAISPIDLGPSSYQVVGQEYLGLYRTLEDLKLNGVQSPCITVDSGSRAQTVQGFVAGVRPLRGRADNSMRRWGVH